MDESIRGKECGCCAAYRLEKNSLFDHATYGYLRNCQEQYPGTMLACARHFNVHVNHANYLVRSGEWDEDWSAVQISVATGKPVRIWRHKKGEGYCEGKKV